MECDHHGCRLFRGYRLWLRSRRKSGMGRKDLPCVCLSERTYFRLSRRPNSRRISISSDYSPVDSGRNLPSGAGHLSSGICKGSGESSGFLGTKSLAVSCNFTEEYHKSVVGSFSSRCISFCAGFVSGRYRGSELCSAYGFSAQWCQPYCIGFRLAYLHFIRPYLHRDLSEAVFDSHNSFACVGVICRCGGLYSLGDKSLPDDGSYDPGSGI